MGGQYIQLEERPAVIFTGNSRAWADFSNLLGSENVCCDEPIELLPDITVISRPAAFRATADALEAVGQEEFFGRCDNGCLQDKNELWKALELLKAFFRMSADSGSAVIFNVR